MADKIFPTQITDWTPAGDDRLLFSDTSAWNATKDCAVSELPISDATSTALWLKADKSITVNWQSISSNVVLDTDDVSEWLINLYDKTVSLLAWSWISVYWTYPNFTVSNSSPDQVVALTAWTNVTITWTYPNFTISASWWSWSWDVVWPASATDSAVALFDTTTGKLLKDSAKTIVTTLWSTDTTIPTSKAVDDAKEDTITAWTSSQYYRWDKTMQSHNFASLNQTNVIGNPTHIDDLSELYNHMYSSWVMHGADLTDNGDGTITLSAWYATIRPSADAHTTLYSVDFPQQTITLTDNATNYVSLSYNAGTPTFITSTSMTSFNCLDVCIAYVVTRRWTSIKWVDAREQNVDSNRKSRRLFLDFQRFIHTAWGSTLWASGLALTLTSWSFYFMVQQIFHPAFDTSVVWTANENVFTLAYRNGSGGHTLTTNQKTISTTQYDNGTGTLATIDNNKYWVSWVYLLNDNPSQLWVVVWQNQYATLADARVAPVPSDIPFELSGLGVLLWLVIYQKSAVAFDQVLSSFSTTFSPTQATTHNGLSGIQWGTTNEYYHLTSSEYTGTGTGNFVRATSPSLTTPNIGAATATSVNGVSVTNGWSGAITVTWTTTVSWTNTWDQTSIVGITGTKAQFDTACSDGNFMYTWDTATTTNALQSATTTVNVSSATAPSSGQVLTATSSTTATWQTPAAWSWRLFDRVEHKWTLVTGTIAYQVASTSGSIAWVKASVLSLPAGANITIQVYKNGTASTNSIFTSDTPLSITTTESATNWVYTVTDTAIDNWTIAANDVIYVVVTQIWSTTPWSDLSVVLY